MSDNKLVFTLKLEPVGSQVAPVGGQLAASASESNWLENDSPDLLVPIHAEVKSEDTQNVLDQLATSGSGQVHVVPNLSVQQDGQGFWLLAPKGKVLLQNGDLIKLNDVVLKATVVKEHVVPLERTAAVTRASSVDAAFDDIWAAPNQSQNQNQSAQAAKSSPQYIDPFAAIAPSKPAATGLSSYQKPMPQFAQNNYQQEDPLAFLYGNAQPARGREGQGMLSNQSGSSSALYAASRPSTSDRLPVSSGYGSNDGGLLLNTNQNYARASASSAVSSKDLPVTVNPHEGNILNDLGIDATTSQLAQRQLSSGKTTFDEQSPMDMLDEYLNDDLSAGRGRYNPSRAALPSRGSSSGNYPVARLGAPAAGYYAVSEVEPKPAFLGKVSGFFKKLAS